VRSIAIIGAGAAGCFCAAELRRRIPDACIVVFEAGPKPLAKVAITGGGRCNLTNSFEGINSLSEAYPRGERLMKRLLHDFSHEDTWRWFESAGVPLVLQDDHCVFPRSQDAMDIVRALLRRMDGVTLRLRTPVRSIALETPDQVGGDDKGKVDGDKRVMPGSIGHLRVDDNAVMPGSIGHLRVDDNAVMPGPDTANETPDQVGGDVQGTVGGDERVMPDLIGHLNVDDKTVMPDLIGHLNVDGERFDAVVVTTGGAPRGLPMLEGLGLEWVPTVPSLFTFTVKDASLRALMGLVVNASLSIPGTSFKASGALLITDWGLSGPATLKLSAYAARYLAEAGYKAPLSVNWLDASESEAREILQALAEGNARKQVTSTPPTGLQARLWNHLTQRAGLRPDIRWAELGSKGFNKLVNVLTQDSYAIEGKTKFREEFVTCGGVALSNVNPATLESRRHPGLYFAGEVLDIDAITGGFNLQAAWTTGYTVARAIASL
jgi:predicted flavoprotein YhiN